MHKPWPKVSSAPVVSQTRGSSAVRGRYAATVSGSRALILTIAGGVVTFATMGLLTLFGPTPLGNAAPGCPVGQVIGVNLLCEPIFGPGDGLAAPPPPINPELPHAPAPPCAPGKVLSGVLCVPDRSAAPPEAAPPPVVAAPHPVKPVIVPRRPAPPRVVPVHRPVPAAPAPPMVPAAPPVELAPVDTPVPLPAPVDEPVTADTPAPAAPPEVSSDCPNQPQPSAVAIEVGVAQS